MEIYLRLWRNEELDEPVRIDEATKQAYEDIYRRTKHTEQDGHWYAPNGKIVAIFYIDDPKKQQYPKMQIQFLVHFDDGSRDIVEFGKPHGWHPDACGEYAAHYATIKIKNMFKCAVKASRVYGVIRTDEDGPIPALAEDVVWTGQYINAVMYRQYGRDNPDCRFLPAGWRFCPVAEIPEHVKAAAAQLKADYLARKPVVFPCDAVSPEPRSLPDQKV
jgi:hypothetical protein